VKGKECRVSKTHVCESKVDDDEDVEAGYGHLKVI
jgi:hypothetical protein